LYSGEDFVGRLVLGRQPLIAKQAIASKRILAESL
jgi:hypothetical protein